MKQYYYGLDSFNRFTEIHEVTPENKQRLSYYLLGEFNESDVAKIVLLKTGLIDNKIVYIGEQEVEVIERQQLNKKERLQELKQLLADSDWKVVVNAERMQAGLPIKYPDLHAERQAWRDEINELEK